ncbi:hypothetical protein NHX12_033144 [Muraenolepis orangiensis]|uniref:Uncharacterized protein n=1 Tax=Muraenolepis orangiensis TaxID=630683 RepID=A0A9Q0E2V0_9TELE|nr:hypothetical protein NHX12_033144 [Muraenolepis orangiensis]
MTAKEARTPCFLYREAWSNKQFLKTKVGPGTYESTDFIQELARKPGSVRGVCSSLDRRFQEVQSCTPGPGNYGDRGVPEKRVTPAGGVVMKHSRPRKFSEGTGGFCDALERPERRRHGVFSSLERQLATPTERLYHSTLAQCPRPPGVPGPGSYDLGCQQRPLNIKPPPFLSSSPRRAKRPDGQLTGCDSGVGPGRYNLDAKEDRKYRSPTSAFKSSTPRFLPQ